MAGDGLQQLISSHPRALEDFLRRAGDLWVIECERSGTVVAMNGVASIALVGAMGSSIRELITAPDNIPRLAPGSRMPWTGQFERPHAGPWRVSGSWFGLDDRLLLISERVELLDRPAAAAPVSGRFQGMADEMVETNRRLHEQNAKLAAANKSMSRLANTDALTGLGNRRVFEVETQKLEQAVREQGSTLSAMVCDLDHFKQVNDTYGHAVGDAVLKGFAAMLRQQLRASDIAIRWGGEEFVVVLPGMDLAMVTSRAEQLRRALTAVPLTSSRVEVSVSIGVGQMSPHESMRQFIQRVDAALYEAKRTGRNRVVTSGAPLSVVRSA